MGNYTLSQVPPPKSAEVIPLIRAEEEVKKEAKEETLITSSSMRNQKNNNVVRGDVKFKVGSNYTKQLNMQILKSKSSVCLLTYFTDGHKVYYQVLQTKI